LKYYCNSAFQATHGFIKKQSKVPEQEIKKATQSKNKYFENKQSKNK